VSLDASSATTIREGISRVNLPATEVLFAELALKRAFLCMSAAFMSDQMLGSGIHIVAESASQFLSLPLGCMRVCEDIVR
jgi:hypothetical protein